MKLKQRCEICGSTTWCERPCINAPEGEATNRRKRGRPATGKAMSGTERSRRHRAKKQAG